MPIVNASVGLQTSNIVKKKKKKPHQFICIPLSSTCGLVFAKESDGSADSSCFFEVWADVEERRRHKKRR